MMRKVKSSEIMLHFTRLINVKGSKERRMGGALGRMSIIFFNMRNWYQSCLLEYSMNNNCYTLRAFEYVKKASLQNVLGLVDVELMNQVLKLDECFEKKRSLQLTESTRGDVLSLMTSGRIVHGNQRVHLDGANVPTSSTSSPTLPVKADSTATGGSCHGGEKVYDEQCGDAFGDSSSNSEDTERAGMIFNEASADARGEEDPVGIS